MDAEGNIIEWFGAASDITRLHQQTVDLMRANRQKNEFLATLSHEPRNPLAAIQTSVDLLQNLPADSNHVYQVLNRQVGHLVRLVDDLMDASRITQNKSLEAVLYAEV